MNKINVTSIVIGVLNVVAIALTGFIYYRTQCAHAYWGLLLMAFFNFMLAGSLVDTYNIKGGK